jgi:hypothetical protein
MGWNEAPTTPDLLDVIAEAIRADTLEVTGPDRTNRHPTAGRIERLDSRTPREVLDGHLADGKPLALAVTLTKAWAAGGGDATIYRVRTLEAQQRPDGRDAQVRFEGFYRGAPSVHRSVSCGRSIKKASQVADTSRARRLAEQWRAMRR